MPIGAAVPWIIQGLSILGQWLLQKDANDKNRLEQRGLNEANRQAVNYQNALQRQYALEDWEKQNQYNSPLQQMTRLRQAGLNPNLVYGSGAANTAQSISRSSSNVPSPTASRMAPIQIPDLGGALGQMYDLQTKQVDLANKKAQTDLLTQSALKNQLQMAGMATKNATSDLQLQNAKKLQDATIEKALLENQQKKMDLAQSPVKLEIQKQELKLKQATTKAQVDNINAETATKLFNLANIAPAQKEKLTQEIDNLKKSGELRQIDINLRQQGLNPSDPAYMRILVQLFTRMAKHYGIDLGDLTPIE